MPRSTDQHTGPVRTCIGCGQRVAQHELLRLVAADGSLLVDPARRAPGRGAYLHLWWDCWRRAERRRSWRRTLRVSAPLDTSVVSTHLTVALAHTPVAASG